MPDAIAGGGKMNEETAITVNWVSNGIDLLNATADCYML